MSAPVKASSPKSVKRSQIVNLNSSSSSLDTSDGEALKTSSACADGAQSSEAEGLEAERQAVTIALEDQIHKKAEQIGTMRHEHELALGAERKKASPLKKEKESFEERAIKARKQLKEIANWLDLVEAQPRPRRSSEAVAEQAAQTDITEPLESTISDYRGVDPSGEQQDLKQQVQEQATTPSVLRSPELSQERDRHEINNKLLVEANRKLEDQVTLLKKECNEYKLLFEIRDWRLGLLRNEQKYDPVKFVEKDDLIKKKEHRYNDLIIEHNNLIGQHSDLQQEFRDVVVEKNEKFDAKDFELNEYKVDQRLLHESRDRYQLAADRMLDRLRCKMTVGDVNQMVDCHYLVVKQDNKELCDKVIWLRKALKSCNKARLAANNEKRVMQRIYDAKIQENANLLEYRGDSVVQVQHLEQQLQNHRPGCHLEIENRDLKIKELEDQLSTAQIRRKAELLQGADRNAQLYIETLQDSCTVNAKLAEDMRQENESLKNQVKDLEFIVGNEQEMVAGYFHHTEDFKVRAYAAEEEVHNLRQQLDRGTENLADPRKWEHYRVCTQWKAHAKIVVQEHKERKEKTEDFVEGLWERMLDFEHQYQLDEIPDPDDYLEEPRRANLKKWTAELFYYDVDIRFARPRVGDRQFPVQEGKDYWAEDDDDDYSDDEDVSDDDLTDDSEDRTPYPNNNENKDTQNEVTDRDQEYITLLAAYRARKARGRQRTGMDDGWNAEAAHESQPTANDEQAQAGRTTEAQDSDDNEEAWETTQECFDESEVESSASFEASREGSYYFEGGEDHPLELRY